MKLNLRHSALLVALLFTFTLFANGQDDAAKTSDVDTTQQPEAVSEIPIKLVHVLNPGEREYLSPNLIGVQNIAMTFLPLSMNFINIVDAFREIVNGVRYEIILNANNTKENDTEIICRLVILEKPWLTTQWGDKVRELVTSNCTADDDGFIREKNEINDKTRSNPHFHGDARNEVTDDEMADLEAQIISSNVDTKPNSNARRSTTTTTTSKSTTDNADAKQATENNDQETEASKTLPRNDDEDDNDTDYSKLTELSENEKKWLDDIFTVGALNFENSNPRHNRNQNEAPIIVEEDENEFENDTENETEIKDDYVTEQQQQQQYQQAEEQAPYDEQQQQQQQHQQQPQEQYQEQPEAHEQHESEETPSQELQQQYTENEEHAENSQQYETNDSAQEASQQLADDANQREESEQQQQQET